MTVPQHNAQLLDVNSHLALEILGQHLAFEIQLLQPIFQVHNTLESKGSRVSAITQTAASLGANQHRPHTSIAFSVAVSR